MTKAICLLSGGLDSAVAMALALREKRDVLALTISYGQVHSKETSYAARLASHYKVPHIFRVIPKITGSSLTGEGEIPLSGVTKDIPSTYVPGRNVIFTAMAASLAEIYEAEEVYTGFNTVDFSGYPDCTPEFVVAMNKVYATAYKVSKKKPLVLAVPLLLASKADIVRTGAKLGVPFQLTWSCYSGGDEPCHACDSCRIRDKAFVEAKIDQPPPERC